ncbi:MAG: D-aminoacylase [bacterium]|nr:D-aminoacylase [candidate division KSB1 bacterium]MDH7560516.1 D-aminoacylase [bacterium]
MEQDYSRREFLRTAAQGAVAAGVLAAAGPLVQSCQRGDFDLLIKGGTLYDGRGGRPVVADLGIRGERIVAIGNLAGSSARTVVEAANLAVTPGFIDVHSHTDVGLLVNPKAESKIRQGVTTEISGNCGASPFPLRGPVADTTREEIRQEFEIDPDWEDADGFLARLERQKIAVNYLTLVGHSSVRAAVMGLDNRPPTSQEMEAMRNEVRKALEQGAIGVSTGLEYTPGCFASTEEIANLCVVVKEYGGIYATHMRNEDVQVEEALEEAIQIASRADVPLELSHLKACQQRNWHKTPRLLERLAEVHEHGLRVHCDRYPYTAYGTTLKLMFPMWARAGSDEEFVARLKDEVQWRKMRSHLEERVAALGSWDRVLITRVAGTQHQAAQGKTVAQLAEEPHTDPCAVVRQLLIDAEGKVAMCGFAMSEENTERVLSFPLTMVGSDGEAVAPYGVRGRGNPHPRFYGTFPRYFGYYVRERKILPLAEAIRRVTSLPAQVFGLPERGVLAKGAFADIVVFDPQTILDRATFTDPHQYPVGIHHVVVNGRLVIREGEHTGCLPGRVLRRA